MLEPPSGGLVGKTLTTSLIRMRARRPPDWLIEERRNTLGHWAAFCLSCGHAFRYFEEFEEELPTECPQCGGPVRAECPACSARFTSAFATTCESCGAELRPPELFGTQIRRPSD
jgi:predicted nucleic acid-binding Zn ribbon protein